MELIKTSIDLEGQYCYEEEFVQEERTIKESPDLSTRILMKTLVKVVFLE